MWKNEQILTMEAEGTRAHIHLNWYGKILSYGNGDSPAQNIFSCFSFWDSLVAQEYQTQLY